MQAMMIGLIERLIRASRLDASLYEEVEADRSATGQAALVVVLSSLCAGLGSLFGLGLGGLILATASAIIGWIVWAVIIYVVGAKILPEPGTKTDIGEILRVLGFASAPGMIRVVGIVDALAGIAMLVAAVWMIAAMVVAVRQALDYSSTARAVGVCVLGFVVQALVGMLLMAPLAVG